MARPRYNLAMRRSLLLPLAALLVCFGLIAAYYAAHKPFTPELALGLTLAAWRMLVAGGILTLAGGLGLRLWSCAEQPVLVRLALQAGLGLGIFSLGILAVGSTVGLPGWLWWLLLAALALLLRRSALNWLRQWAGLAELWRESGRFARWLAVVIALLFLLMLMVALAPPLHFDSLAYHLVMPRAYLDAGRIAYLPWIVMTGMPQATEMLHTWAMALGGSEAATTLVWFIGLVACAGLLGYLRRAWDARAAWVGLAALLGGYTPVKLLSGGYVDWAVFLYALGALALLETWRKEGNNRALLAAGLFTGLAVGAKYTSGVLALAGLAVVLWIGRRQGKKVLLSALRYGLPALIAALPWFARNALATGNPLYPFFFTGGAVTPLRLAVYQHLPPWGNWMDVLLLPFRATLLGADSGDGYMFSAGPLLLGLGLLAWLLPGQFTPAQRINRGLTSLLGAVGLAAWALGNQLSGNLIQTRYYFSIFPAFAALAAAGDFLLRQVNLPRVRLERVGAALVLLVLGLNALEAGSAVLKQGAPQAALGLKSQSAYLAENLGWFQPAMQAVGDLPEGQRALLLYEPRSLYCVPRCAPDEILDRWKRTRALQSVGAVKQLWRAEGFTHILLYRQGVKFLVESGDPHHPPEDLEALNQFLAYLAPPVDFGGVYELYALDP